jgi:hypothetical protein
MVEIKMVNGDTFSGDIIYNNIRQVYIPIKVCSQEFVVLQNSSGQQWLIAKNNIISIYDKTQG